MRDARVQRRHDELARDRVGLQHAEVGDDELGAPAAQAVALPVAGTVEEADRGPEVASLHERTGGLAHDDHHHPGGSGDLRGAAGAGKPRPGRSVRPDDGGVDVAEAVELGAAKEADVDPAGLQPVAEDLGHAHHGVGGLRQLPVTDGEGQPRRLRADAPAFVHEHGRRVVQVAGEVGRGRREADAHEADAATAGCQRAQCTRRVHDHDVVGAGAVRHGPTRPGRANVGSRRRRRWRGRARRSRP